MLVWVSPPSSDVGSPIWRMPWELAVDQEGVLVDLPVERGVEGLEKVKQEAHVESLPLARSLNQPPNRTGLPGTAAAPPYGYRAHRVVSPRELEVYALANSPGGPVASIVREVVVSCPPSHVFGVLSDLERLPEFSGMTVEIRNGPGHAVAVGDTFDQIVKVLGVELDTEWEVTEVRADSLLRFEGRSKSSGRASLTETVVAEGQGSRVRFEIDYDPPWGLLGEVADKVLFERRHEEEAESMLARLKQVCEIDAAA